MSRVGSLHVELSADSAKLTAGLSAAEKAIRQAQRETKKFAEETERNFRQAGKSVSLVSEHFGRLGSVLPASLSRIGEAVRTATSSFSGLGASAARFAGIAGGVVAVAGAAAASLFELGKRGAEYVERLTVMSQKTGLAVRDLQAFEIVAKNNGASLEDVVTAMKKLDQGLTGVGRHTGIAASVLRELGVTGKDNKQVMLQLADAFAGMADGATKTAYAVALFGKAGTGMIPVLNKGREGFEEAETAAKLYGATITKDVIEKQEQWKASTTNLATAWDSFAVSLVPVLGTLTRFNEVISELLANNSKFRIFLALLSGAGAGGAMRIMAEDAAERVTKIASAADVLSAVSKKGYGEALDKRLAMNEDAFNRMAAGSSDIAAMEKVSKELAEAKAAKRWEEAGALFKQLELLKQLVALDKETPARGYTERERNQMIMPGQARGSAARGRFAEADMRKFDIAASAAVPNIIPEMPDVAAALSGYGVPKPQEAPAPPVPSELTRYSIPLQREDNKAYFDDLREKMKAAGLDMLGVNAAELASQRALTREWDSWSLEAGSAGQKAKAMFQELSLEGDNFAKTFWAASHAAIEGLEKHLATFIVTGRRRDAVKIGVAFEETVLTGILHAAVGKAAGGLVKLIPSLGKIPGVGDLAKGTLGTRGNPMIVQSVDGAAAAAKSTVPDLAGIPLPGPARVGVGLPDLGGVTKAIAGAGGAGSKGGLGGLFGSLSGIFKSLFGTGKAGSAPTAGAVSDAKGSAFKANLGKLAKFDEGFQPSQKKSGGLFGMLGSLASIGAMFIPGGQALSAGMMALKAGLTAAPMLGGGLDALTGLANGGDVTPGQAYVVGEKKPELFVPNAAGRIYPSVNMDRKGGGGETNFNFAPIVHATDAEGVDRMLVEHGRVFAKHFQQWARRENA